MFSPFKTAFVLVAAAMASNVASAQHSASSNHIEKAVVFIANEEEFRAVAYDDLRPHVVLKPGMKVTGTLTIGYGFTGADISIGDVMTEVEAREVLAQKVEALTVQVSDLLGADATEDDLIAFVSFAFNVGLPTLRESTALKRYKQGDRQGAAEALGWYNKAGGAVLKGLVNRRAREGKLIYSG